MLTDGPCVLQAVLGGNSSPSADDINKILGSGVQLFSPGDVHSRTPAGAETPAVTRSRCSCIVGTACPVQCVWSQQRKDHSMVRRAIGRGADRLSGVVGCVWLAVGIEADSDRVEALISELEGKDIAEVIAAGVSKLASVPAGGGGAAMASTGGAPPGRAGNSYRAVRRTLNVSLPPEGPLTHT